MKMKWYKIFRVSMVVFLIFCILMLLLVLGTREWRLLPQSLLNTSVISLCLYFSKDINVEE